MLPEVQTGSSLVLGKYYQSMCALVENNAGQSSLLEHGVEAGLVQGLNINSI